MCASFIEGKVQAANAKGFQEAQLLQGGINTNTPNGSSSKRTLQQLTDNKQITNDLIENNIQEVYYDSASEDFDWYQISRTCNECNNCSRKENKIGSCVGISTAGDDLKSSSNTNAHSSPSGGEKSVSCEGTSSCGGGSSSCGGGGGSGDS